MKNKVLSIMAVVLFMSSSLNANTVTNAVNDEDCLALFDGIYDIYFLVYEDSAYAWQAATWAYQGCVSNGGDPGGDSVVIISN